MGMIIAAMRGAEAELWTALPGIVHSYNATKQTCEVQTVVMGRIRDESLSYTWVPLPLLVDCPVVFPSAGGFSLTFPIAVNDEVLVVFSSRCIDAWYASGQVSRPPSLRMHDLSDGFVLPGVRSYPRRMTAVSTTDVQLRSDDGSAYFSLAPDGHAKVVTPGAVDVNAATATVTAPTVTINGNVTVNGTITATGNVTASDFATSTLPSYVNHIHQTRTDDPTAFTKPPKAGT